MDQILLWISLAAGLLTAGVSLLRSRWPMSSAPEFRRVELTSLLLVAAAAGLTLLQQPPFSPGQTLWPGLLVGALVTLFGAAAAAPVRTTLPPSGSSGAWAARFGAAAAGVALLLVLYSARALDVLVGYALGALTVAVLIAGALPLIPREQPEAQTRIAGAEETALLIVSLAAAAYLATFHRGPTGIREWQALPALLAAAAGLMLAVRDAVVAPAGRAWLYGVGLVAVPVAVVAGIAATRLNGTLPFLWVTLLGFGLYAAITLLEAAGSADRAVAVDSSAQTGSSARLVTALLVIGGGVIAFRELHGFGLALFVLSGWIGRATFGAVGDAGRGTRELVSGALGLGLMLVLYRVFVERNEYTRGFQADFLYYYAALLTGALLPSLLAALGWSRLPGRPQSPEQAAPAAYGTMGSALARMALVGSLAALSPLAVWMLIGDRPEAALLVGLAIGTLGLNRAAGPDEYHSRGSLERLLAPATALSAVQFTHLLTPLALRTRGQRLEVLVGVTAVVLLAMGLTAWWERHSQRTAAASA